MSSVKRFSSAYERREREMAWETKALIAICQQARTWQAGDGSDTDPLLVTVSDAARIVGRLVVSVLEERHGG
jgi:hypothetical protein